MGTKEFRQGSHLLVRDNFMGSEARKKARRTRGGGRIGLERVYSRKVKRELPCLIDHHQQHWNTDVYSFGTGTEDMWIIGLSLLLWYDAVGYY